MCENPSILMDNDIRFIVSCLRRDRIEKVHAPCKCLVLYIPMEDSVKQSLWASGTIELVDYSETIDPIYLEKLINMYKQALPINAAIHFISKMPGKVLVHCYAGISRSVSIVTACLISEYNMDYNNALKQIGQFRTIANPNQAFRAQLLKYSNYKNKK